MIYEIGVDKMSFEIIDFHTHPFIKQEDNLCFYKESLEIDKDIFLEDTERAGISKFCGSVICRNMSNGFESLKEANRESLKLREMYGGKYIPGFHVHPDYVEESISEVEFAAQNGVKIIGELVPYMHGWEDYSCKGFSEILNTVAKHNMIVSVHTINFEQMEKMASEHKDIKFVFAHPGQREDALTHIRIMKKCENVYLDLSGTGLFRYGLLRHLSKEGLIERVLFGTDYPICNPVMYVNGVLGERIPDHEKELILGGNAKRILG